MPEPLVNLVSDQEIQGQAKKLFEQIKKSTDKVPKWMRVMANCEDVLVGFFTLFKATMDNAPVDAKLKWKIAYRISEINKCEFCVSVSENQLKTFGLTKENMKKLNESCDDRECIALEYAEASTEHAYNIDPKIFARMKKHFSDEEIVEITSVVGLFSFINRFNDSLGVLPDM
ncbi:carboxymuconolactone decarboxylase family protein [bacterium]|nr:carboxymuconolactone decarboxylase family protein [bacterium]